MNGVSVANMGPGGSLQPGVAVEAAAAFTDLRKPRPHIGDGRIDGDGSRGDRAVRRDQLVAWKLGGDLFIGGTPPVHPRPQGASISRYCACRSHQSAYPAAWIAHTATVGPPRGES